MMIMIRFPIILVRLGLVGMVSVIVLVRRGKWLVKLRGSFLGRGASGR